MEPSYLTNDIIRNGALYDSLSFYLKEGETTESLVKKNGGNLIKTIQYLRERAFENIEPILPKPVPVKKSGTPAIEPKKSQSKKKPSPLAKNQSDLF